ncbi:MAG: hypothetical protein GWO07_00370 [Candidatus Dadabacteria bacterium]|nr:hypothetical protein [Candidatus Dadabacteria bacterium]NIS07235.1 hypothetical protein [Candidatus Dadabacteria bacterium]NIV40942.1 hypothetical protein [Candidatus Dadabacteria bacterium]NIX14374.1 hypothetical protein [Candidatus Dadabacteria bacterium]NIY20892.1 hypothetical protein [Candidatus Dadabacteria bacterium]
MKYILTITLISLFTFNTTSFSQKIYQWEEQGVDNYSNNPAEVPYEKIYDDGTLNKKSNASEEQAIARLNEELEGPAKEKLKLILEAEAKIENIIISKKKDLINLKKQKNTPTEKIVELENYIFKAEHNLKVIRHEKTTFIKQNTNI